MAKFDSSSYRPLLQGMLLLALLLLASIQAGPVMAFEEQALLDLGRDLDPVGEKARDLAKKAGETWANKAFTELGNKKKDMKDFSNGGKAGLKVHKYLCKAQGWMDKQNPAGDASGTPYSVDVLATSNGLGRGGDGLSRSFPTFSYYVTSEGRGDSVVVCWSAQPPKVPAAAAGTTGASTTTLVPGRYPNDGLSYVRITGIRVGQELVQTPAELNRPPPPAYLSTTRPYTYLGSSLYGRLRAAVIGQMNALNPEATPTSSPPTADKLCYAAAAALSVPPRPRLPALSILLASDNNVMQTMELLGGATNDTVWYQDSSIFCLGIRRTMEALILGRP